MALNKTRLAVGTLAIVGGGLAAGAVLAGGGATAADQTPSAPGSSAPAEPGERPDGDRGPGGRDGHEHTEVTGAELTKVTNAVKAHDADVTVESARKDQDGSYDVFGTRGEDRVMLKVSADLATVTEREHGPGGPDGRGGPGGPGGPGGHEHTEVTGAELAKVTDAVEAKDPDVTIESVRKDPDGSYDVLGTRGEDRVMLEVSADLATVTERELGPGERDGGHGRGPGGPGRPGATDEDTPSGGATPSSYRTA